MTAESWKAGSGQSGQGAKKMVVVGGTAVVLLAMVVAVAIGVSRHKTGSSSNGSDQLTTSSKAVQAICQPTDYKEECVSSLNAAAGDETDPKKLIELTFDVAINRIRKALDQSIVLLEAAKDPRTSAALDVCKELLEGAISHLRRSVTEVAGMDLIKLDAIVDNLKIWLSAALTHQDTCLEGFENKNGYAAKSMSKLLNSSAALTCNTLAIIDEISSVMVSFQLPPLPPLRRRLLSEEEMNNNEFPSWVSRNRRRLLALPTDEIKPNVTVAQDGSGDYKTIKEALAAIPVNSNETIVIYIKEGVYMEVVQVLSNMINVMMIGDGPTKTKISAGLNYDDGVSTFRTATLDVMAQGFMARNLGIENTAGAAKHQAVAVKVQGDMSVFYQCQIDGYQDTLYVHTQSQFYRDCTITGTIDFLFGNSQTIFQNCLLVTRQPGQNQICVVTAQGRTYDHEPTAIVLHNCTIIADPTLPAGTKVPTFLGRPWRDFARVVIIQSEIGDHIKPEGWTPMVGDTGVDNGFFSEFDNRGPGAVTTNRVAWRSFRTINMEQAQMFTVEPFIRGSLWLPATGVPYAPGLINM